MDIIRKRIRMIGQLGRAENSAQFIVTHLSLLAKSNYLLHFYLEDAFALVGIKSKDNEIKNSQNHIKELIHDIPNAHTRNKIKHQKNKINDLENNYDSDKYIEYDNDDIHHLELSTALELVNTILENYKQMN